MNKNSILYSVLEASVLSTADVFNNNVPYHNFSRRYMRKEKDILKAYIKSKETQEIVEKTYSKISFRNKIVFAILVVIAALLAAGFTIYVTHYISNMRINEYDTYSLAFAVDSQNAPKTLENRYEITYDLNSWEREIIDDDQYEYFEIYRKNDEGINFSYRVKSSYKEIRYNTEHSNIETKIIGDKKFLYYISPTGENCLIWDNNDCIMELTYKGIEFERVVEIIKSIKNSSM